MRAILLTIPVIIILTLAACSKTCYCKSAALSLDFVAFDSTETDTVVLRRYDRNSFFTRLLDTSVITTQNANFNYHQDTLSLQTSDEASTLRSFYDYIVFLPSLNRSDSLFGINEWYDTEKGSSDLQCNCTNRIVAFYLNRDSIPAADPSSPHAYIRR